MHTTTNWKLEPSLIFDALCCLNVLSGDDFYVPHYAEEYEQFRRQFTPEVITALKSLKVKMKDEGQQIISALLCLYFSATDDQSLADLLRTVEESSAMLLRPSNKAPTTMKRSGGCTRRSARSSQPFSCSCGDIGFDHSWRTTILPRITERISSLKSELAQFNIVVEDEALLGRALPSNEITIYVLHYARPHGRNCLAPGSLQTPATPCVSW